MEKQLIPRTSGMDPKHMGKSNVFIMLQVKYLRLYKVYKVSTNILTHSNKRDHLPGSYMRRIVAITIYKTHYYSINASKHLDRTLDISNIKSGIQ